MRPLRPRKDRRSGAALAGWTVRLPHLEVLITHQLHTGSPMLSPAPVMPEERRPPTVRGWSRTLTWRGFVVAVPFHWHCWRSGQGRHLRMLAPYTTRRLPSASRRCSCRISFWEAWQRSVPSGWRAKSCPEKRPARPAQAHVRGSIARGRSRVRWKRWSGWRRWDGRSKLGRAHGIRMQLMPQLQAEVPDPSRYQLPAFLSPGRVRAPAIGVLFVVFI